MKKIYSRLLIILAVAFVAGSCAKVVSESSTTSDKRFFDAFMRTHHPDAKASGMGVYILDDQPGTGEEAADSNYIFMRYTFRDITDGSIQAYADETIAKQLGEYDPSYDYSPFTQRLCRYSASQGVMDVLTGEGSGFGRMKIGGSRQAVIPGWLTSNTAYYDNAEDYLNKVNSSTHFLYSVTLVGQCKDIKQYQIDSIESFMKRRGTPVDSLAGLKGMYYWRNKAREQERGVTVRDTVKFPTDTTIYINYIGRLLNGKVFDTSIKDTAKAYGIYSSSRTYEPVSIVFDADSTKLKMGAGESGVITGFALSIWQMHPYESGRGIFTSDYGYKESGSGKNIGGYAPLIFDIDVVDKP